MREIAACVGIKAGSLYNHYASKEDLLFEIALSTMKEMLAGGRDAIEQAVSFEAQLRCLVEWHVRYCAENRLQAKVADDQLHALSEDRREQVLEIRDDYESLWRQVLSSGCEEDGWAVDDVAIVTFALATMASSVGIWFRPSGRMAGGEVASIYADLAVRAVRADHPAAATGVGAELSRED